MRTLIPIALLVGSVCAGTSVHSAPDRSLNATTYLGTFEPADSQAPAASGPAAYDDKPPSAQGTRKPDAPVSEPSAAQAPSAQPSTDTANPGEPTATTGKPEPAAAQAGDKPFDVKNNFRNICSFCHADYGRKAGRGPQLMDSPRSDEFLFDRIKHGLTGRMPGFGGSYSDAQIHQFVKFIRSLKPGEEPKNPT